MKSPATTFNGADSQLLTNPSSSDSMPTNMMGPSTNPPARLAGTLTSEAEPKVIIETGAVDRLAAVVIPTCCGRGPGRNPNSRVSGRASSSRPATAPNDSWKLTSKRLLGLRVRSHAAGTSHSSQPSVGREASTASSPTMPADAGAHDGRRRPGEQHVRGDDGHEQRGAHEARDAEQREGERPHAAEQDDVLAGDGHDVEQAATPEVVDRGLVDALVVAEDHALQHLAHGAVHARAQMRA